MTKPKVEEKEETLEEMFQIGREIKLEEVEPKRKRVRRGKAIIPNKFIHGKSDRFLYLIRGPDPKKVLKKPKMEPVNKKILETAKKAKKPFISRLGSNLEEIRNLLVLELAPRMIPVVSAVEEAKDVLKEIMDDKVESRAYDTLMKYVNSASEVRLATWVANYMGMDKFERRRFYARLEADRDYGKKLSEVLKLRSLQGSSQESNILLREIQTLNKNLARQRK